MALFVNPLLTLDMLWAIWYYLYNLKNVKNTHGGELLLVKLQASACYFTKVTILHGCFSRFLNSANGTKSRKTPLLFPHICCNLVASLNYFHIFVVISLPVSIIVKTIDRLNNTLTKYFMKFSIKLLLVKYEWIQGKLRICSYV